MKKITIFQKKYVIPLFRNKHINPYGYIILVDNHNNTYKRYYEINKKDTFIISHQKYKLINSGSLYKPKLNIMAI